MVEEEGEGYCLFWALAIKWFIVFCSVVVYYTEKKYIERKIWCWLWHDKLVKHWESESQSLEHPEVCWMTEYWASVSKIAGLIQYLSYSCFTKCHYELTKCQPHLFEWVRFDWSQHQEVEIRACYSYSRAVKASENCTMERTNVLHEAKWEVKPQWTSALVTIYNTPS